jgi:TRAP-type C4-dicarboxylate transport system permease small subunit
MRSSWIETGLNGLAFVNGLVATVLFAALTLVVALQVFTRFVLHDPFIWSEEAARFLFFWVVLLGAAMSVKDRRHFVIDVTMGREVTRGRTLRFLFDIVPGLCVLGFSLLLLVEGIGYTEVGLLRIGTNSRINMALVYGAIPVFAALSAVYSAGRLLLDCAAFLEGRGAAPRPLPSAD